MADHLYLSLWFPTFAEEEMMPRAVTVLRQFPFSPARPGITYLSVRPVAMSEPTVLERRFGDVGIGPEEAIEIATDLLHDDFAYDFEAFWELWVPDEAGQWTHQARPVTFTAYGIEFDEGMYQERGHIEIDLGLDTPFVFEHVDMTRETEMRVRTNVQKLIEFTATLENNAGISGRVLWSDSDENLAQKLITRLQQVQ